MHITIIIVSVLCLSLIIGSTGIYLLTSLGWAMLYMSAFFAAFAYTLMYLARNSG